MKHVCAHCLKEFDGRSVYKTFIKELENDEYCSQGCIDIAVDDWRTGQRVERISKAWRDIAWIINSIYDTIENEADMNDLIEVINEDKDITMANFRYLDNYVRNLKGGR